MQPKSITETNQRVKSFYTRAQDAARQQNHDYAIEMYQTALKHCPEFRDARLDLRKVEVEKIKGKTSSLRQTLISAKNAISLNIKGPGLIKKGEYSLAFQLAEGILAQDPTVPGALKLLANAAVEADMEWLAIDTFEFFLKFNKKDSSAMKELVDLYLDNGRGTAAVELCQSLQRLNPNDSSIQSLLNSSIARQAMDNNWVDGEESKVNSTRRTAGPAPTRVGTQTSLPTQGADELIEKYQKLIDTDSDTVEHRKKLARALMKANRYDDAVDVLEVALEMVERVDPTLQNMIYSALEGRFESAIQAWEEFAQNGGEDEVKAREEIVNLQSQRAEFFLHKARERAATYSMDANVHMDLALLLWERGETEEAAGEFAHAQASNRHRKKALLYKAKCYALNNDYDQAITELNLLISELPETNEQKVEALYELARIQEAAGSSEESLETYKLVHEADASYLNVEEIINNS